MRAAEFEAWVLEVVDAVLAGSRQETTRIELKSEFPTDTQKAARQIAAHANAARGDEILWIIGVDEAARIVVGIDESQDPESWWARVEKCFEGLAPRLLRHDVVPVGTSRMLALLIETDRAPFVVKNPLFGKDGEKVELEVPWRDGTRTRSARREDLLRLLLPASRMPYVEVVDASLEQTPQGSVADLRAFVPDGSYVWTTRLRLFVVPRGEESAVVFPGHRIRVQAGSSAGSLRELQSGEGHSLPTRIRDLQEWSIERPQTIDLSASDRSRTYALEQAERLQVFWSLVPAGSSVAVAIQVDLRKAKPGTWTLEAARVDHVPAPAWKPAVTTPDDAS